MSRSLSSSDLLAMVQSEQVAFILTATVRKRRVVEMTNGESKTVVSASVLPNKTTLPVMIDGDQWTLKYDEYSKSVILERWDETPAQAKANALVRAAAKAAAAEDASAELPA